MNITKLDLEELANLLQALKRNRNVDEEIAEALDQTADMCRSKAADDEYDELNKYYDSTRL